MFVFLGFDRWAMASFGLVGCIAILRVVANPILCGAQIAGFRGPVVAYLAVISTMCIAGWATGNWLVAFGASLFVISDAILGWSTFVKNERWMNVAIMVTYHAAIFGLALSLMAA